MKKYVDNSLQNNHLGYVLKKVKWYWNITSTHTLLCLTFSLCQDITESHLVTVTVICHGEQRLGLIYSIADSDGSLSIQIFSSDQSKWRLLLWSGKVGLYWLCDVEEEEGGHSVMVCNVVWQPCNNNNTLSDNYRFLLQL